jgi:U3 small nucleolar RNA-associated protein 25
LGIRITRGQIKLFADPMQSDIIIASPVGLATKLAEDAAAAAAAAGGSDGRGGKKGAAAAGGSSGSNSSGAADFLSSIEICVIERADVMLMQNWQHVVTGE